jgi:hypothetical protein
MSMKNDTIANRTHDLSACSAVPQPTAPPRVNISHSNVCGMKCTSTWCVVCLFAYFVTDTGVHSRHQRTFVTPNSSVPIDL